MEEAHASPYASHRGILATTIALEKYFFWPTLKTDIDKYVCECVVYTKTWRMIDIKFMVSFNHSRFLDSSAPWESIAMDLIIDFSRSQRGNDAIWIIVDRFSEQAHFLPIKKTIKANHMARISQAHIFKHRGMPKTIVSKRDPRMISLF